MKLTRPLLATSPGNDNTSSGGGVTGKEPGAVDNRLSLDPSNEDWSDKIDGWNDGEKYSVTVEVTQISPGEFEVTGVTKAGPSEEGADDQQSGDEETAEGDDSGGDTNPAISKLME